MKQSTRAAIFVRPNIVAPGDTADQGTELARFATERDWTVIATFHDRASFLSAVTRHQFDALVVSSLDQLGDSLRQVVATVHQLRNHGVHLYAHAQSLDTSSPAGPAVLSVFAALAECERAHVRERARAGLERARRTGTKIGRPSNVNDGVRAAIVALHQRGLSIRNIARQLRVGNSTVCKVLQAAMAPAAPQASPNFANGFRTAHRPLEPGRNGASA